MSLWWWNEVDAETVRIELFEGDNIVTNEEMKTSDRGLVKLWRDAKKKGKKIKYDLIVYTFNSIDI